MGWLIGIICGLLWVVFCVGSMILIRKLQKFNYDEEILTGFFFFGAFFGFITFWIILHCWKQQKKEHISPNPFPKFDEKPYISSYFESRRKVLEEAIRTSDPKDAMVFEEAYEYFLDAENLSHELNGLLKKSFDLSHQVKTTGYKVE